VVVHAGAVAEDLAEDLVDDDRAAVMWAVFSKLTRAGRGVAKRMSRGEQQPVSEDLLVAIRDEWHEAGRPIVHPHTHRDPITFADGTTVIGARFLVPEPYTPDEGSCPQEWCRSASS
jgi:hypothetical protein